MTIIQALTQHGIEIKECCGRLLALEIATLNGVPCDEWIDVTDWSMQRIANWLGY